MKETDEEEIIYEERGIDIGGLENKEEQSKENKESVPNMNESVEKKLLAVELEELQKKRYMYQ